MNLHALWAKGVMLMLCLFPFLLWSQKPETGLVLGTFIYSDSAYTFEFTKFSSTNYSFVVKQIDISDTATKPADSVVQSGDSSSAMEHAVKRFSTFNPEIFRTVFVSQMKLFGWKDTSTLRDKSTEVFAIIEARLKFLDDEPVTAYLLLKRRMFNSYFMFNRSNYYNGELSKLILSHVVHQVHVEIYEGAIKNIEVLVINPDEKEAARQNRFLSFKNMHPISISAKFDKEGFANTFLYSQETGGERGVTRYLRLSDLLDLQIIYAVDKEDYSPDNGIFKLGPDNSIVEMKKVKRSRIVEVAAFTDMAGVDDDVPNGLIQIEGAVRVNINTKYRPMTLRRGRLGLLEQVNLYKETFDLDTSSTKLFKGSKPPKKLYYNVYFKPNNRRQQSDSLDIYRADKSNDRSDTSRRFLRSINVINRRTPLNYVNFNGGITFRILFSKLDQNNRFIPPDLVSAGKIEALELLRYQTVNIGLRHQFLRIYYPQLKFQWNVLDVGINWSRAVLGASEGVKTDSIPINSSQLVFGSSVRFKPDERWGVSVGIDYIRWMIWSRELELANNRGLLQPYLDTYIWTNTDSRIFLRFRWTHSRLTRARNFTQVQLGYTMDIFK